MPNKQFGKKIFTRSEQMIRDEITHRSHYEKHLRFHKFLCCLVFVAMAVSFATTSGCKKDTPKSKSSTGTEKQHGDQVAAVKPEKPEQTTPSANNNTAGEASPPKALPPIPQLTNDTIAGNIGDYSENNNGHFDLARTGTWSYLYCSDYAGAEDARFKPMGWDSSTDITPHYEIGDDNQDGKYRRPCILKHNPRTMEMSPFRDNAAVVRWKNNDESWLRVRGQYRRFAKVEAKDGIHVWVMCDGMPRFHAHVAEDDACVAFDFTTMVLPGSCVDFVVTSGDKFEPTDDRVVLFACIDRVDEEDRSKEYATWTTQVKQQFEETPVAPLSSVAVKLGKAQRAKAKLDLAREVYIEPYLKFGNRKHPRDQEVTDYLERVAECSTDPTRIAIVEELVTVGEEFIRDPDFFDDHVAFAYSCCLVWASRINPMALNFAASPRITEARKWVEHSDLERQLEVFEAMPLYGATFCLRRVELFRGARWAPNRWKGEISLAIDLFIQAMSEEGMTNARRAALLERLKHEIALTPFGLRHNLWLGRIQQDNEVDPWLKAMLIGRGMATVAWQARGTGYASEISEDGKRIHQRNMSAARFEFLRARDLIPELPESAIELLRTTVQVGGVAGETPRFWFDRAIEREFDFDPAYQQMSETVLLPKWGGSHEEMLQFGRECVRSGRFETNVPRVFHQIVRGIKSEVEDPQAVYSEPELFETYSELLEGYRSVSEDTQDQNRWTSQLAAVAFLTGQSETASNLLDELGDGYQSSGFAEHGTSWIEVATALKKVSADEVPLHDSAGAAGVIRKQPLDSQNDFDQISANLSGYHGSNLVQEIRLDPTRTHLMVTHLSGGHTIWPTKLEFSAAVPIEYSMPQIYLDVDMSPTQRLFATAARDPRRNMMARHNPLRLLNTATGQWQDVFTPHAGIMYRVRFASDGKILVAGGQQGIGIWDGNVLLINPQTGRAYDWGYLRHRGGIAGVACSSDGLQLAVAERHGVAVWDLPGDVEKQMQPLIQRFRVSTSINASKASLVFSPDGSKLIVANGILTMVDTISGEPIFRRRGATADFSPDSKLLVVGGGTQGEIVAGAEVIEVESQAIVARLKGGHSAAVTSVAFLPDGEHIATGDEIGVVRTWNLKTQKLTNQYGELPSKDSSPFQKEAENQPGTKRVYNSIGMPLVHIPPGQFVMGSPTSENARNLDEDQHEVTITKPFLIGQFEVTQDDYKMVMNHCPSAYHLTTAQAAKLVAVYEGHLPVEQVSWQDAVDFCERLSRMPAEVNAGRRYRLPTEAEWEFACRAGTDTAFSTGDTLSNQDANVLGKGLPLDRPRTVGTYRANKLGVYDMHGNVREWCQDWYGPYVKEPQVDPTGPKNGVKRVMRGAAFRFESHIGRSAKRHSGPPNFKGQAVGFRVVCEQTDR